MNGTARFAVVAGSILGAAGVAAGAFGAHGLRESLEASGQAANWETACRYAMHHALALVAIGAFAAARPGAADTTRPAAVCLLAGTLIFSGLLAVLAVSRLSILGAIVPVGGVLLIAGWVLLAIAACRG